MTQKESKIIEEPLYMTAIMVDKETGRRWAKVIEVPAGHNVKRYLMDPEIKVAYAYGDHFTCQEIADSWNRGWFASCYMR